MRGMILLTMLCVVGLARADDSIDAGAAVYRYFEIFNAKDAAAVANTVYATPVHIGGGSSHSVLADPAAAIDNLTNLYVQIEAQGWKASVIENVRTCALSDTFALVDTRYSRLDQEGDPIPPAIRTVLYVLQKIENDWRIVAFYSHDNDKRPACAEG